MSLNGLYIGGGTYTNMEMTATFHVVVQDYSNCDDDDEATTIRNDEKYVIFVSSGVDRLIKRK